MRHGHSEPPPLEIAADPLRHQSEGPIGPGGGLDHGIARHQGFPLEQGRAIEVGLLPPRKRTSQAVTDHALEPAPGLQGQADRLEGEDLRRQCGQLVDHQLAPQVPALRVGRASPSPG